MATVGTLTVDLIAQTASFNANISKAAANLNSNATRMNRSIAGIQQGFDKAAAAARAFSLLAAGGALVGLAKQSLDFASAIGDTAQQIGVSSKELQVYRYAATQAGLTQEEMETGLRKLTVSLGQAALGAKAQGAAFAALGISVRDSTGHVKTAGQVLPEIANALERIKDPAQRAAAEVAIFGRAGQKLDPILSRGADNIDAYAKRAEELGLVLDDKLIDQADEAADRMAELTTQMKVSFAGVVASNANAILGLANALSSLTSNALQFIATYPKLSGALAGAALGSRIGGLPGALLGGAAGAYGGSVVGQKTDDANMDVGFRRDRLNAAIAAFKREREIRAKDRKNGQPLFRVRKGNGFNAAFAELQKQMGLSDAAMANLNKPAAGALPPVDLPAFLASGGGGGGGRKGRSGPSPEELAEREARRLESFYDDLARFDSDLLSAKMANTADSDQLAALAKQQLTIEMDRTDEAIKAAVVSGELKQAEADKLLERTQQLRAEKLLTINTDALEESARERLDITLAANDNERDILQGLEALATTQAERRAIALSMLDLDEQEERLRLQQIIDLEKIGKATAAEARIAEDRLAKLPQIYADRRQGAMQSTEGPMDAYIRGLPNTAAEMDEALQNVKANGLKAVEDGLVDIIINFENLGDVAKRVLKQIAADLLRLAIQKMIFAVIGGGTGGGVPMPGFATGGFVSGPGTGTSDSINARLSDGEFVVNAAAVRKVGLAHLHEINSGKRLPGFGLGGLFKFAAFGLPGMLLGGKGIPGSAMFGFGGDGKKGAVPTGAQVIPNHRLPQMGMPGMRARNDNGGNVFNIHVKGGDDRQNRRTADQVASAVSRQQANARRMGLAG